MADAKLEVALDEAGAHYDKRTGQPAAISVHDERTSHKSLSAASAVGAREEAEDGEEKKLKSVALEAKSVALEAKVDKKLKSVGKEAEDALEALEALEALAEPLEQHVPGDKKPVSPLHCQFLRFY